MGSLQKYSVDFLVFYQKHSTANHISTDKELSIKT